MLTRMLLTLSLLAATSSAQPRPRPTFPATTSYEACTKSWAFACGMRDSAGNKFGTAREITHCERYVFQPDGTFQTGFDRGTYKIVDTTVKLIMRNDDGSEHRFELVLSPDGATLGGLKRVTR